MSVLHRLVFPSVRFAIRLLARLVRGVRGPGTVRRSLWAGTPILTLATKSAAERLLGIEADSLVFRTYFVTRAFTYDLSGWTGFLPLRFLLPYLVLVWAVVRYQRFHFFCDRGLLPQLEPFAMNLDELGLLRELGKEVFLWTYGADVRTRARTVALGTYTCCTDCPLPGSSCICDEDRWSAQYRQLSSLATRVFSMGDMVEYTPGSRNDLFFWPLDLGRDGGRRYAPAYPDPGGTHPVRIVHAPNHRAFKGTRYLEAAVARLRDRGIPVELVLVEGVQNDKALEIYRGADLVFDQCLIGFHGYFALEAMAMGKPVIAFVRKPGGYLLDPEACPLQSADPDGLEALLESLIGDRTRLAELGRRGRSYVERHMTLEAFSRRLAGAYRELGARVA